MKKPSLGDIQFLVTNKTLLFSDPDIFMQLATGKLKHPKINSKTWDTHDALNTFDDAHTFGQLIAWRADELNMTLNAVSLSVQIPQFDLMQIYDDAVLPWHLPIHLIIRLAHELKIPNDVLLSVLENHYAEHWVLKRQLEQVDSYSLQVSQFNYDKDQLGLLEKSEQQNKRRFIVQLAAVLKKPE
jgi:hypothetical protein